MVKFAICFQHSCDNKSNKPTAIEHTLHYLIDNEIDLQEQHHRQRKCQDKDIAGGIIQGYNGVTVVDDKLRGYAQGIDIIFLAAEAQNYRVNIDFNCTSFGSFLTFINNSCL